MKEKIHKKVNVNSYKVILIIAEIMRKLSKITDKPIKKRAFNTSKLSDIILFVDNICTIFINNWMSNCCITFI